MNATQPTQLAAQLWAIVDFCMKHRKAGVLWDWPREKVFRFVAFCSLTGKIAYSVENNQLEAVVFYWCDWKERVEAKHENNMPQFEWEKSRNGDCLFLGDCVGSRRSIGKIYQSLVERFPNTITIPILTYRRKTLVTLNKPLIERFINV